MENLKSNLFSHLTAKDRESLSFPARLLLNKNLLIGDVLDFGCGFGKDVELLKTKNININGYDKYHFPKYPEKRYDTVICFYVLNVILPEEQADVLMEISKLIKTNGKAYFAVRRDLQYEGFRTHKVHQKPTYQCNVILPFKSIYKNESCEIYEYSHYNQISNNELTECPFCKPDNQRELIVETATAYSIYDKFPVNEGHALIIPKRHVTNYFELTAKEQIACLLMLNKVKSINQTRFKPDGYNVGININEEAGQTVPHVHIHLIPRYKGDVKEPRGGVRGVIPNKQKY